MNRTRIFAQAIARAIGSRDGLSAAYLPEGVSVDEALHLALSANVLRRNADGTPYALVVTSEGVQTSSDVTVVTPTQLLKYRLGDRLAVIVGRAPELASVTSSFSESLAPGFPLGRGSVDQDLLERIAAALLEVLRLGSHGLDAAPGESRERLVNCLLQLRSLYLVSPQAGDRAWQSRWFAHVSESADRLAGYLDIIRESDPARSVSSVLAESTYAAFGLPRPNNGMKYRSGPGELAAKRLGDALEEHWGTEDSIQRSLKYLEGDIGKAHPLSEVEWGALDDHRARTDDLIASWAECATQTPHAIRCLSELTESEFLQPMGLGSSDQPLEITTLDGRHLSTDGQPQGPYLLRQVAEEGFSEKFIIRLDAKVLPDVAELALTGAQVRASGRAVWEGQFDLDDDGVIAVGRLNLAKVANATSIDALSTIRISLNVPAGDPLAILPRTKPAIVHLLPRADAGVLAFPLQGKAKVGRGVSFAAASEDDGRPGIVALDSADTDYRLMVWAPDGERPLLEGRLIEPAPTIGNFYVVDIHPQGVDRVEVSSYSFELHAPLASKSHASPLLAAIRANAPSSEPLEATETESLRGLYESWLVSHVQGTDSYRTLWHVALPEDAIDAWGNLNSERGVLVPEERLKAWDMDIAFNVPESLIQGQEAERFRQAFESLDLMGFSSDPHLESVRRWPSRYPRRKLWTQQREALAEYLDAYTSLVMAAREHRDPQGVFWAAYPFSVSAWSYSEGCQAVFLSPVHPLRLAWLAAAEATLWEAEEADALAGTVQGFGFPIVGPGEESLRGMLAVQGDQGRDQVFLGWTTLAAVATSRSRALKVPGVVGGHPAPGVASSGLNGAAVDAALRSYRRIYPQVSTLTVDLAASTSTPRSREVDDALVGVLGRWLDDPARALPGGARVLDSANREGNPPVDDVMALLRSEQGIPFSWSRYLHEPSDSQSCNVRLLQDAGLKMKVGEASSAGGVVGRIPLRRLDSSFPHPVGSSMTVEPGVDASMGWEPLSRALDVVEARPALGSTLSGGLLVDPRADWIVSGESLISPAGMAQIMGAHGNHGAMLWEWRPPLLASRAGDGKRSPSLDHKPYLAVARIPASFQNQLGKMLTKASGVEAGADAIEDVLTTLGGRGVGLSSLLAMGGTHASGALGFHLAFKLLDKSRASGESVRLALPIDASDDFLLALAGDVAHAGDRQRADILAIDVRGDEVVLAPIEIKFYGLGSQVSHGTLPTPESAALGEPLQQALASHDVLERIASISGERVEDDEAERALWSNALSALLEVAAKLDLRRTPSAANWSRLLARVVDGEVTVRAGRPIVLFFNHDASFIDGTRFKTFRESPKEDRPAFGAFVADSATTLRELDDPGSPLGEAWAQLLDWAMMDVDPAQALADDRAHQLEDDRSHGRTTETEAAVEAPDSSEDLAGPEKKSRTGIRFPVGELLYSMGKAPAFFWPSNTQLNQLNIGVVGDLGTGKTQLLKALVYQLKQEAPVAQENPLSFLIFDYKRDFQDDTFIQAVNGRVLRPFHIPLNFFELVDGFSPQKIYQRATAFVDVLMKIYAGIGPVQRSTLIRAILESYGHGPEHLAPTIYDVGEKYAELVDRPDSVSAILDGFVFGETFSRDRSQLLSFDELMDNQTVIVSLSDLGVDQQGKNALVTLFLNMYYDYMLKAKKWPFVGTDPQLRRLNSFLLVDEATNIMQYEFEVLKQLLLQGREFGFGVILSSQYLSHFKTGKENYGEPLRTWFIHKVPDAKPRDLSQLGLKGLDGDDAVRIAGLDVHQALYSSLGHAGDYIMGTPFYKLVPVGGDEPEIDQESG